MKHFLIVVDLQNDFVDGALGTKEAVEIIPNAVKRIEEFDGEIIVTYDTHTKDYLSSLEGKKLPVTHCIKDTYGWQLNEKIKTALKDKNYITIEKPTFGSVALPNVILEKSKGEDFDITLIGLCTDICVVSNALVLKANFTDKEIYVDSSCTAGVTVESHNASLKTMQMCQINIV